MKNEREDKKNQNNPVNKVPATKQSGKMSNEANYKGAIDKGREGTEPTASQQQGQGSWRAKDHDNRSGSDSGQNTNNKDR